MTKRISMTGANYKEVAASKPGRETELDGLRGLAALLVIFAHGIITFDFALYSGDWHDSRVPWDVNVSGAPFLLPLAGNLSVCVFFALSGYVLSRSFSNTSLGSIALLFKRYTRFTPTILAACLISYALLAGGLMENQRLAVVTKSTWLARYMLQAPSLGWALRDGSYRALVALEPTPMPYDSVLWTMRYEFWGSVMLIAVFSLPGFRILCSKTCGLSRILLLAALGAIGCTSYLGLFAFGALLNLTQLHRKVGSRVAAIMLAVGLFLGTVPYSGTPWSIVRPFIVGTLPMVQWVPFPHSPITFYHSLGAMLILVAAKSSLPFRTMLSSKSFQFLGEISYPLYLIHFPLLMSVVCSSALALLHIGLPNSWTVALSLALFLAVSLLAAIGLLFVCDRPSIALSSRVGLLTDRLVRRIIALSFRR